MQATECFVSLFYLPGLPIKLDFNHIFRVGPMVHLICLQVCIDNLYDKRDLEKETSSASAVFGACFDMVDESFCREENITELALHRNRMFEDSLVNLD